ncbi:MAG TPA: hypothetical protein VM264_10635 [Acidimicrobiales bacterium]|nr:hypothetical protein [Acidimicrobiales bacterium]
MPTRRSELDLSGAAARIAERSFRPGVGDRVARACFAAATHALGRLGVSTATVDAVAAYADRYVARGRTPADDVLDRFQAAGGEWRPAEWMCAARYSEV